MVRAHFNSEDTYWVLPCSGIVQDGIDTEMYKTVPDLKEFAIYGEKHTHI